MDITKMLADLREEREQVEQAILVLERIGRGQGKRRGRPPAWMTQAKRRGRPPGSKNKPKGNRNQRGGNARYCANLAQYQTLRPGHRDTIPRDS